MGDQEIYIEDVVDQVSSQLEELPIDKYQQFRSNFCAELVATASGTQP